MADCIGEVLPQGLEVHPPASATQLAKGTTTEGVSLIGICFRQGQVARGERRGDLVNSHVAEGKPARHSDWSPTRES